MPWLITLLPLITVLTLLSACSDSLSATVEPSSLASLVVDHNWLASHLGDGETLIVDTREQDAYDESHIDGAIHLPASHTMPKASGYMLPPIPELESILSQAGINASVPVVVYDDGDCVSAARWFWALEAIGHENVAVLRDGFLIWKEHHPISTETTTTTPGRFIASIRPKRLATHFDIQRATEIKTITIIDNRLAEAFHGTDPLGHPTHIPTAIHVAWNDHLIEQNQPSRLRPIAQLAELYKAIPRDHRVITYCLRGKKSSISYLALRMLGYDVAGYDGSWHDWLLQRKTSTGKLEFGATDAGSKK